MKRKKNRFSHKFSGKRVKKQKFTPTFTSYWPLAVTFGPVFIYSLAPGQCIQYIFGLHYLTEQRTEQGADENNRDFFCICTSTCLAFRAPFSRVFCHAFSHGDLLVVAAFVSPDHPCAFQNCCPNAALARAGARAGARAARMDVAVPRGRIRICFGASAGVAGVPHLLAV